MRLRRLSGTPKVSALLKSPFLRSQRGGMKKGKRATLSR